MKSRKCKVFYLILLLILFETIMYCLVKLTPMKVNLIGTDMDANIPFVSEFVYAYISWYIMLFIVPYWFYKCSVKSFNKYYLIVLLSIIFVSIVYVLYPTTINRPNILVDGLSNWIVNLIYTIDTPALNCFPSMHCLISFVFIYLAIETKDISHKLKIFIIIWSILVILSTIFIKQHVLMDVISAFLISFVIYKLIDYISLFKKFKIISE